LRAILIALAAFLISVTAVNAQLSPPNAERAARLAVIAKWTLTKGRKASLIKGLARDLGFGDFDSDLQTLRLFASDGDENIVFSMFNVNGVRRYIFSYSNPTKLDAWNIDSSGAVVAHVLFTKAGAESEFRGGRVSDPDFKLLDDVVVAGLEDFAPRAADPSAQEQYGASTKSELAIANEEVCGDDIENCNRLIASGYLKGSKLAEAYFKRGFAYRLDRKYQEAIRDFDKAVQLAPSNADYYWWRGCTHEESGNKAAAKTDFARGRKLGFEIMIKEAPCGL
jgi:tetratricopeptide (TPR) repeat protein